MSWPQFPNASSDRLQTVGVSVSGGDYVPVKFGADRPSRSKDIPPDAYFAGDPQSDETGDPQSNVGLTRFGRGSGTPRPIGFKLSGFRCLVGTTCPQDLRQIGRGVRKLFDHMYVSPVTRNRVSAVPCGERHYESTRAIRAKFSAIEGGTTARLPADFRVDTSNRSGTLTDARTPAFGARSLPCNVGRPEAARQRPFPNASYDRHQTWHASV